MERKLAAILSGDVAGFSRLIGLDEEGTLRTLDIYRKAIDEFVRSMAAEYLEALGTVL